MKEELPTYKQYLKNKYGLNKLSDLKKDYEYSEERTERPATEIREQIEQEKKSYNKERGKGLLSLMNKKSKGSKGLPKIKKLSATKTIMKMAQGQGLVRKGRTGYFNEEYEENISWLS